MEVSRELKATYDQQYEDPSILEWRNISAKSKAEHIVSLSEGLEISRALDVGCGEGSILSWLDKRNFCKELYGVDISESGVKQTKNKQIKSLKEVTVFDGYRLPYEDNYFDLAYCSHVVEHVEFPRQLIREIRRVSNYQIYEIPIDFSFYVDRKINQFLSYGHINIYTPALFRFLLFTEGYTILRNKYILFNDEILDHLYRNNKMERLKYKIKCFFLKMFPYLLGIKPSHYAILTKKAEKIEVFK